MRKAFIFFSLLALLLSTAFLASRVLAEEDETLSVPDRSQDVESSETVSSAKIIPAPDYDNPNLFGQKHSYTVVFRGNGEAIVSARIVIANTTDKSIEEVNFRIPKVQPSSVFVFQIFKEKQCIRYEPQSYDQQRGVYKPPVCAEYQEPDYFTDYFYHNLKYKKADYEYKNDTLTIKFPSKIPPNKSGALFIYFRSFGYTNKNVFGAYNYTFETFQSEDQILNLNIGISTDSDLYLKNAQGEVNYRFSDISPTVSKIAGGTEGVIANPSLDSYISQIGNGRIYKYASNLQPLETYKVEGSYATSRAKLYGREILIAGGIFLFVIFLCVAVLLIVLKLLGRKASLPKNEKAVSEKESGGEVVQEKPQKQSVVLSSGRTFIAAVLVGFLSSLLIVFYTVLVFLMGSLILNNIDYTYRNLFSLILVLTSILIYGLLIIAPAVLIGVKRGAHWGVVSAVATVVWLIFESILLLVIIFLFGGKGSGILSDLSSFFPPWGQL